MSLDILKERFGGKLITSQYEDKIEIKEKIIEKLEEKTNNLSNQVVNLENEKNTLLQELNKSRHFEEGAFSIKEKDYMNQLQSKENTIKEINSQFNPLHAKINEQKDRLSYKDKVIEKAKKINKQLNEKLNKLNYKLNHETKNSKKVVNEVKTERKRVYQEYVNNLDTYEKALVSKNDKIDNYKTKLKESLDKLKEANNLITNLQKDIKINENVRQELREKKEEIINLNGQVYSLSKEVTHLTNLSQENSILEAKLEKAQSFQDIIVDRKDEFDKFLKETNNLSTFKLVATLTEISREKQGSEKLTWNDWLKIPESNYLFQLDETIAKKIFNESQLIADKSRISLKANLNEARHYSTGRGDEPDLRLEPLKFDNLQGYYSFSTLSNLSNEDNVSQWSDLSGKGNHLTQGTANAQPEYNASKESLQFKRGASDLDHMDFTTGLALSEFTLFFALEFDDENRQVLLRDTAGNDLIEVNYINANRARLIVNANDGTDSVSTSILPADDTIPQDTKLLLTCRKQPFNSDDGFGQVEWFLNKTSIGTNDDYDENILQTINELGFSNSSTGFEGHIYEMAIYNRALPADELLQLQNYFINRTSISV